jgi:hypothetical protein
MSGKEMTDSDKSNSIQQNTLREVIRGKTKKSVSNNIIERQSICEQDKSKAEQQD